MITFVAVKGRKAEIYTISRDGSRLRQLTKDGLHKKDPAYSASGERLLYVERNDGKWQLMQIALGTDTATPHAVPGGQGWSTLHAGAHGSIFGQLVGEDRIRILDPAVLATSAVRSAGNYVQDGPRIAAIDAGSAKVAGPGTGLVRQAAGQAGPSIASRPMAVSSEKKPSIPVSM